MICNHCLHVVGVGRAQHGRFVPAFDVDAPRRRAFRCCHCGWFYDAVGARLLPTEIEFVPGCTFAAGCDVGDTEEDA